MTDKAPFIKRVSFLATGNEIIEGEVQDTNGQYFATCLHDKGARIFQHVHVSDDKSDIVAGLSYLLEHSDAVITTGGLGPTSDDNTRFAVAEVTERALALHEPSWQAIQARLAALNVNIVESNRQQAMMPEVCDIYPNLNGSAPACHVEWKGKHIFMLPGPPRECRPIFDHQVVSALQALSFFDKHERYRWTTLGLSEGEIAETIDAMAKPFGFETGYRWSYPYLVIKVMAKDKQPDQQALSKIDALLDPYCVSRQRKNALEMLDETLEQFAETIFLVDEINEHTASPWITHPNVITIDDKNIPEKRLVLIVASTPKISQELTKIGSITFSCRGYVDQKQGYEHTLTVPLRGKEVAHAARAYTAWQLGLFARWSQRAADAPQ